MKQRPDQPLRAFGFRAFLCTQFLGAFNDNLFKLLICFLASRMLGDTGGDRRYVPLAGAMLTLPFLTFSSWAGHVADHFSKKKVMVWVKVAEIVIMTAGFFAFAARSLPLLLFLLFLMGAQSAFFSPAKYGFLPETLPPELLSRGNGKVQMWTFVSIILGTATATGLATLCPDTLSAPSGATLYWASSACVLIAVLGTVTSLGITSTPPGHALRPAAGRGLPTIWRTLKEIHAHPILRRSLAGSAYFWFLGALFQLNILLYAQREMGASEQLVGMLLAATALGIGFGSELAGRISGDHIEFRLVPLGAMGMAFFSFALLFLPTHPRLAMVALAALGLSAGFFSLPLTTAIQRRSPEESRGRYLGTTNFVNFSAMTAAAGFLALVLLPPWVKPSHVFLLTGLSAVAVLLVMFVRHPSFLSQLAMWVVPAPFYRLRVRGAANIPETGGALLVSNHISFADAPLLQTAVRGRPIRFLIHKSYYEQPFFRFFARRLGCIPIAAEDSPKELISSLRAATEAIRNGDLVCVFPEAMISRLGVLLPFRRGVDLIMRRLDAPIVPVALGGLWGDQLSFRWGSPARHGLWRWLNRPLRYPVTAHVGEPLPANTPCWKVREHVAELLLAADEPTNETASPGLLLLRRAKGRIEEHRCLPSGCRAAFLDRAIQATACAMRLGRCLSGRQEVTVAPDLSLELTERAHDTAALLGRTIVETGDGPVLGTAELSLHPSPVALFRGWVACHFLPVRFLVRQLRRGEGSSTDLRSEAMLRAARRFSDAFRLGPGDVLGFVGPEVPRFSFWCSLYSGCALAEDVAAATVLVGTADTLANASGGDWRLVVCLGSLDKDQRVACETSLGTSVHCLVYEPDGTTPVVAELPESIDGVIHQQGRRAETAGLPVPGTLVRAVSTDGSLLPPGTQGTLESLCHQGKERATSVLGTGTVDADGFVAFG